VNLVWGFLWSMLQTSILLGRIREFVRGRREGRPLPAEPATGSADR